MPAKLRGDTAAMPRHKQPLQTLADQPVRRGAPRQSLAVIEDTANQRMCEPEQLRVGTVGQAPDARAAYKLTEPGQAVAQIFERLGCHPGRFGRRRRGERQPRHARGFERALSVGGQALDTHLDDLRNRAR